MKFKEGDIILITGSNLTEFNGCLGRIHRIDEGATLAFPYSIQVFTRSKYSCVLFSDKELSLYELSELEKAIWL